MTTLQEPDWEQLLAAAPRGCGKPDALVVVGGDGMVNLGASLLAGTKVPLGLSALGDRQRYGRSLGIPTTTPRRDRRARRRAQRAPPRIIDAGRIRYVDDETGGAGDPLVRVRALRGVRRDREQSARTTCGTPKGPSRTRSRSVMELAKLKPIPYRLTLDGELLVTDGALISVGNAQSLGGGMMVTLDAVLDDGLFDVLVVQPARSASRSSGCSRACSRASTYATRA